MATPHRPVGVLLAVWLLLSGCRATPARPTPWAVAAVRGVHWPVPHRRQADGAACGPCALWSVLSFQSPDRSVAYPDVEARLRPPGSLARLFGVLPGDLVAAARAFGFAATTTTDATTAVLRQALDDGLPVILLGDVTVGQASELHYVVVDGYRERRGTTIWFVADPLDSGDADRRLSTPELMAFWDDVRLLGQLIPYQRTIVTIAPPAKAASLPPDNRTASLRGLERLLHLWLAGRSPAP